MAGISRRISRRAALGSLSWAALGACAPWKSAAFAQALRGGLFDTADPTLNPGSPDDQSTALARALTNAAAEGRPLFLPPGRYEIAEVMLPAFTHIVGVPGRSRLAFRGGRYMLAARHADWLTLEGVTLAGQAEDGAPLPLDTDALAMLNADDVAHLVIDNCRVSGSSANGVTLRDAAGRVTQSEFDAIRQAGIDLEQSRGMEVSGNRVTDCGDTGILVARDAESDDNSIVIGNRVTQIRAESGGTGQNGNGINLDKANGVIVADNRVDDCAFSAIRCFSSDALTITGNIATRLGEMALYVEFAFEGAVVADNLIDGAVGGISFANFFEHGGRLGTCSGNVVRRIAGSPPYADGSEAPGAGISAEADVAITGNVVEDAAWGLQLGWGPYRRDLTATGNVIRRTEIGVAVSAVEGGGPVLVANNVISEAERGAVLGMRWQEVATEELAGGEETVPGLRVEGNEVG